MTDIERLRNEFRLVTGVDAVQMEKQAISGWGQAGIAAGSLVGGAALGALMSGWRQRKLKKATEEAKEEAWTRLTNRFPEFTNSADERNSFDAVWTLAPSLAQSPEFVAPILRQSKDYGTRGIPVETAAQLAAIDTDVVEAMKNRMELPDAGYYLGKALPDAMIDKGTNLAGTLG